jgi:hypothetical protein
MTALLGNKVEFKWT